MLIDSGVVQIEGGPARGGEDRRGLSLHIRCASWQALHWHAGLLCLVAPMIDLTHIGVGSVLEGAETEAEALPHVGAAELRRGVLHVHAVVASKAGSTMLIRVLCLHE